MSEETIEIPLAKATYEELQQIICELQIERYEKDKEIERLTKIEEEHRKLNGELRKQLADLQNK